MQSSSIEGLLARKDQVLFEGNIGLLSNQTSFSFKSKKYLFEILSERGVLRKVFIPEHGLFAELQDQTTLDEPSQYQLLAPGATFISIYQSDKEKSLKLAASQVQKLDAIIIDLQDVGARYYTFLASIKYLFDVIIESHLSLQIYLLDHINPAGRQVEGSMMTNEFSSFIGLENLPHRYGLSIGELGRYFNESHQESVNLEIIESQVDWKMPIQPSPNIPDPDTCKMYSGQCLFEGTVLSEGRGTTKPFQLVGAPFLDWKDLQKIQKRVDEMVLPYFFLNRGIILRPTFFLPKYDQWADQMCGGFQLHLTGAPFHSLLFSAILLRTISEVKTELLIWRKGSFEYGNDKTALELLAADDVLLDYIRGNGDLENLIAYLRGCEFVWLEKTQNIRVNSDRLFSLLLG